MIPAKREQFKNLLSLPSPELLNRLADEARKKKKKRKRDEFSDAETGALLESLTSHRLMLMNIPAEPNKTRKTTPAPQNSQPHMPPPVKVTKYPSSILNQLSKVTCKLRWLQLFIDSFTSSLQLGQISLFHRRQSLYQSSLQYHHLQYRDQVNLLKSRTILVKQSNPRKYSSQPSTRV